MVDFFQNRLEVDVPKRVIPTVTFTARQCPVCLKWARILVRPPQNELQCEICVDFCQGNKRYPSAHESFRGSWLKDGNAVIETLKGADGTPGRDGRDAAPPSKQELKVLLREVLQEYLDEQPKGFWRRFKK
jgi:hypothetical protein